MVPHWQPQGLLPFPASPVAPAAVPTASSSPFAEHQQQQEQGEQHEEVALEPDCQPAEQQLDAQAVAAPAAAGCASAAAAVPPVPPVWRQPGVLTWDKMNRVSGLAEATAMTAWQTGGTQSDQSLSQSDQIVSAADGGGGEAVAEQWWGRKQQQQQQQQGVSPLGAANWDCGWGTVEATGGWASPEEAPVAEQGDAGSGWSGGPDWGEGDAVREDCSANACDDAALQLCTGMWSGGAAGGWGPGELAVGEGGEQQETGAGQSPSGDHGWEVSDQQRMGPEDDDDEEEAEQPGWRQEGDSQYDASGVDQQVEGDSQEDGDSAPPRRYCCSCACQCAASARAPGGGTRADSAALLLEIERLKRHVDCLQLQLDLSACKQACVQVGEEQVAAAAAVSGTAALAPVAGAAMHVVLAEASGDAEVVQPCKLAAAATAAAASLCS